jgi:hypothetical protein
MPTARACAIYYTYMPSNYSWPSATMPVLSWLLFNLFYLLCPALPCAA